MSIHIQIKSGVSKTPEHIISMHDDLELYREWLESQDSTYKNMEVV